MLVSSELARQCRYAQVGRSFADDPWAKPSMRSERVSSPPHNQGEETLSAEPAEELAAVED